MRPCTTGDPPARISEVIRREDSLQVLGREECELLRERLDRGEGAHERDADDPIHARVDVADERVAPGLDDLGDLIAQPGSRGHLERWQRGDLGRLHVEGVGVKVQRAVLHDGAHGAHGGPHLQRGPMGTSAMASRTESRRGPVGRGRCGRRDTPAAAEAPPQGLRSHHLAVGGTALELARADRDTARRSERSPRRLRTVSRPRLRGRQKITFSGDGHELAVSSWHEVMIPPGAHGARDGDDRV